MSDLDTEKSLKNIDIDNLHNFLTQLEKEFNSMIESIEKYGGFYIGRYETGNLERDTFVIKKGNFELEGTRWEKMYKNCKKLSNRNTSVETGIIWGCQWDRTLMWLVESNCKTKIEIVEDSTSWGNFDSSTFEYINSNGLKTTKARYEGTIVPTGNTKYTEANNIYDLAGNVIEVTMEGNGIDNRVLRGGMYTSNGVVSERGSSSRILNVGCRAMLYIK